MKAVELGKYGGKKVCFDVETAVNQHVLLLGKTGSGKSVEAQKIILELAKQGKTIVILDAHSVVAENQIFYAIRETFMSYVHEIEAYDNGIPCNLFTPITFADGQKEKQVDTVGAVLDMLSRAKRLGSKQHATLRKALGNVVEQDTYEIDGFAAVDRALAKIGTEVAETVREKLYPLTIHNVFRAGDLFVRDGKINIIRLSKFDLETQDIIVEVVLAYLWRLATISQFSENGLYIFADEFQNLPSGKGCALGQILSEGRKFNVNLILATQQVTLEANNVIQQRIMQSGLILFFQPNTSQISAMAKLIEPQRTDAWLFTLQTLEKGEFVAFGPLLVNGVSIRKPLKVDARNFKNCVEKTYSVNGVYVKE